MLLHLPSHATVLASTYNKTIRYTHYNMALYIPLVPFVYAFQCLTGKSVNNNNKACDMMVNCESYIATTTTVFCTAE